MKNIVERLQDKDWHAISNSLNETGHAVVKNILTKEECNELIENYASDNYRKTVAMERYRFGIGEYKYFSYHYLKSLLILEKRFTRI